MSNSTLTVSVSKELSTRIDEYIEKNDLNVNKFLKLAIEKLLKKTEGAK